MALSETEAQNLDNYHSIALGAKSAVSDLCSTHNHTYRTCESFHNLWECLQPPIWWLHLLEYRETPEELLVELQPTVKRFSELLQHPSFAGLPVPLRQPVAQIRHSVRTIESKLDAMLEAHPELTAVKQPES